MEQAAGDAIQQKQQKIEQAKEKLIKDIEAQKSAVAEAQKRLSAAAEAEKANADQALKNEQYKLNQMESALKQFEGGK
jgi:hypothetical protein